MMPFDSMNTLRLVETFRAERPKVNPSPRATSTRNAALFSRTHRSKRKAQHNATASEPCCQTLLAEGNNCSAVTWRKQPGKPVLLFTANSQNARVTGKPIFHHSLLIFTHDTPKQEIRKTNLRDFPLFSFVLQG
jgi:hypothetical protein